MSIEDTPTDDLPPRTDLYTALATIVCGTAITVGAWTMDRLEHLHINKYEAPGLVPGLLGAAMLLLGLVLAMRSLRRGALNASSAPPPMEGRKRMAGVFGITLLYALVLVGHGIAFWLATFVFVSAFIFLFDAERQAGLGRARRQQLVRAFIYGLCTSAIVTLVFEHVFLVRLP